MTAPIPSSSPPPCIATDLHANPATAGMATASPREAVPAPPPLLPSPAIQMFANELLAQVDVLEAKLKLDIAVAPNDLFQHRALTRVPDSAIALASRMVQASPAQFVDFADLPAAADYVFAMQQVAARVIALGTHLQKSVQNMRAPAAHRTLVLYAVAKGLGRIAENESVRERVEALRVEISAVPGRRGTAQPKQSKEEQKAKRAAKAQAAKLAKARALVARMSAAVAGGTPPPTAVATSDSN